MIISKEKIKIMNEAVREFMSKDKNLKAFKKTSWFPKNR